MYLEGIGIRSIERLENVPASLIVQWIRKFSKLIRHKLSNSSTCDNIDAIQILEVDELFTYIQKKPTKLMFGLPLIGSKIKLLICK